MKNFAKVAAITLLFVAPELARAQSQACRYEGREFPEGSSVCQGGLRQNCVNGEWQNLDGARCDTGDSERVAPEGSDRISPQGGFVPE